MQAAKLFTVKRLSISKKETYSLKLELFYWVPSGLCDLFHQTENLTFNKRKVKTLIL